MAAKIAEVIISETEPGEKPLDRAAVDVAQKLNYSINKKTTRSALIEFVKNAVNIPIVDQNCILARIEAMDAKHDLLWLTATCHPHKGGANFSFTVVEI